MITIINDDTYVEPKDTIDAYATVVSNPPNPADVPATFILMTQIIKKGNLSEFKSITKERLTDLYAKDRFVDWLLLEVYFEQHPDEAPKNLDSQKSG
jgi:hypothetical protein